MTKVASLLVAVLLVLGMTTAVRSMPTVGAATSSAPLMRRYVGPLRWSLRYASTMEHDQLDVFGDLAAPAPDQQPQHSREGEIGERKEHLPMLAPHDA
jgi:hypothetical protein